MPARPCWRNPLLWIILIFLGLAVACSFIIPSFESMDEPEHFNYMRYVADGHGLPDQRDVATARAYNYYQEGGQPPLYYVIGAVLLRMLGEDVSDVESLIVSNPFSTCGEIAQPYSKGLWMRDPRREALPLHGAALGVHMVRLLGPAFGAATIVAASKTARSAFPAVRNVGLMAAALVAFNPRFLVLSGTITNDTLLTSLCAWGIFVVVGVLKGGPAWTRSIALGGVAGLAGLTKISGAFLVPMAALGLLVWGWRTGQWNRVFVHLLVTAGLAAALGGWWYVWNLVRYGDPGIVPLLTQQTGRRVEWPARLVLPEIRKFYASYWARANYCELRLGWFPLYGALSALGVVGIAVGFPRMKIVARQAVAVLAVWVTTVFVLWLTFNSAVYAPNGRYLFQASGAIGPLLAVGLLALVGQWPIAWRGICVGLAAAAIVTPAGVLGKMFAAPRQFPVSQAAPAHPLEANFGDGVRLLGYDVGPTELRAGEEIEVAVFLSAVRPITEDLALGLQLKSAGPRDESVLINLRNWPGGGNLPTTAWEPGKAFVDRYRLRTPKHVESVQDWELRLMFFEYPRKGGDDRLPVFVEGVAGGPYVVLADVRVEPSRPPTIPAGHTLNKPFAFGPDREVVLEGVSVALDDDRAGLVLTLWWRAKGSLGASYTVFVHLLDSDGELVGSGDGRPRGGAMPTERWQPGDLILDRHWVPLSADLSPGIYGLNVGFYNESGRLPAWYANGDRIRHDSARVVEWTNGGA